MDSQLIGMLLLIELVLVISTTAPLSLSGRFNQAPNLGIGIWLLLGFGGVLLAITNLRLAPYFEARNQNLDLDSLATKHFEEFEGVLVRELALPGYFAIAQRNQIFLSTQALRLPIEQKQAVLWHELGHLKLGHLRLKAVSAFALTVAPWFLVSKVFDYELRRLCERAADNYALRKVDVSALKAARRLFI